LSFASETPPARVEELQLVGILEAFAPLAVEITTQFVVGIANPIAVLGDR
jgi:hypothetical protein